MPSNPDARSYRLRFGPYSPPAVNVGDEIECEIRGMVEVVDWSDRGHIMWPLCRTGSRWALVVGGDLARAMRMETELAVARHWNVAAHTVMRWKRALRIPARTPGTEAVSAEKSSEAMRGRKALPRVKAALLRAAKRPKSKKWRARLSARNKLRALMDGQATSARDADRIAEMLSLREQGHTLATIGRATGVSRQCVEQTLQRATTRRERVKDRGFRTPRCACGLYSAMHATKIGHFCLR